MDAFDLNSKLNNLLNDFDDLGNTLRVISDQMEKSCYYDGSKAHDQLADQFVMNDALYRLRAVHIATLILSNRKYFSFSEEAAHGSDQAGSV